MKRIHVKKVLAFVLLVLMSASAWSQTAKYWIIQDGIINPKYRQFNMSSEDGVGDTLVQGVGKSVFKHNEQWSIVCFDLTNSPIDLSQVDCIYMEYALPKKVLSESFVEEDKKEAYFRFELFDDVESSQLYGTSSLMATCYIDGRMKSKANQFRGDFSQIFSKQKTNPAKCLTMSYTRQYDVPTTAEIKNLYICSTGKKPFYAEDFEGSGADLIPYYVTKDSKSYKQEDGTIFYKILGDVLVGEHTISSVSKFSLMKLWDMNPTDLRFLDQEMNHSLCVEKGKKSILINEIEIPTGATQLFVKCAQKTLEQTDSVIYSPIQIVFDNGKTVSPFSKEKINSGWINSTASVTVPSGATTFEIRFPVKNYTYVVDNIKISTEAIKEPTAIESKALDQIVIESNGIYMLVNIHPVDGVGQIVSAVGAGDLVLSNKINYNGSLLKIKGISNGAFDNCEIYSITGPYDWVSKIGFAPRTTLTSAPDTVWVNIEGKAHFSSLKLPTNVKRVSLERFNYQLKIDTLKLSDLSAWCENPIDLHSGVSYENLVFSDGTNLSLDETITIPEGTTRIGSRAICNNQYLKSITIPNSVKSIKYDAVYACYKLEEIVFTGSLADWIEGDREEWIETVTDWDNDTEDYLTGRVMVDGKDITEMISLVVPSGVTRIGNEAFLNCRKLGSVSIPSSVESIGKRAFESCNALTEVFIPDGVTKIDENAFYSCLSLKEVVLPSALDTIVVGAFSGGTFLEKVTCMAAVPPVAEDDDDINTFADYENTILYVPCDSKEDYEKDPVWGKFAHIECVTADLVVDVEEAISVEPMQEEAVITWMEVEDAESYELIINEKEEAVQTITFDSKGQMMSYESTLLKSGSKAFSYVVRGLSEDTEYTYELKVKKGNKILHTYDGAFRTLKSGNAVNEVASDRMSIAVKDRVILWSNNGNELVSIYNALGQCLYSQVGDVRFQVPCAGVYLVKCASDVEKVVVR